MNSLTYITRQLNHSASYDRLSQLDPGDSHLKRSETWSKPFYFRRRNKKTFITIRDSSEDSSEDSTDTRPTIARRQTKRRTKRSFSSPALLKGSSTTPHPSTPPNCSAPPLNKVAPPSSPPCPIPIITTASNLVHKESHLYRRFRRLYLVRAFALVWNTICATYDHIIPHPSSSKQTSSSADKDSEDEAIAMALVTQAPVSPADSGEGSSHAPTLEVSLPSPSTSQPLIREPGPSLAPSPPHASAVSRRQTPFQKTKTLVLDLDETLIHSTIRPMRGSSGFFGFEFGGKRIGNGHVVEVHLNGRSTKYHVYKRPFVDYFLRKVSSWYTIVIFTASMQEYADPVIDWLDAGRGVLRRRFFRDSCTPLPSGSYTKDLSLIEEDLSRVCLIDNSPVCYSVNPANAIPIEGWTHDLSDEALLDLLPVLDSLRFTNDVRRVLGLRGFI